MVDHAHAGELLAEMTALVRAFKVDGQRGRERTLTGTKVGILQQLREHDARLGELAIGLSVSAPVISRAVDQLESDGLVERRKDSRDARATVLSATDRGRAELAQRESLVVDRFTEALTDWSPEDAHQALHMLRTLTARLGGVLDSLQTAPATTSIPPPDAYRRSTTDIESEIHS